MTFFKKYITFSLLTVQLVGASEPPYFQIISTFFTQSSTFRLWDTIKADALRQLNSTVSNMDIDLLYWCIKDWIKKTKLIQLLSSDCDLWKVTRSGPISDHVLIKGLLLIIGQIILGEAHRYMSRTPKGDLFFLQLSKRSDRETRSEKVKWSRPVRWMKRCPWKRF